MSYPITRIARQIPAITDLSLIATTAAVMGNLSTRLQEFIPNRHLRRFLILLAALFLFDMATGLLSNLAGRGSGNQALSAESGNDDDESIDVATVQVVQFPPHASARYLTQTPAEEFVAELVVQAPSDPDVYNVLKVERAASAEPVVIVYIDPARQVRMRLPPAKYRLKLARGKVWQGDKDLFGKQTRVIKTNIVDLSPRRDGTTATATVLMQGFVDGTTRGGIGIRGDQF